MKRVFAAMVMAVVLTGCNVANSLKEGLGKSTSAAAAIEKRVGQKPEVGFNVFNGKLTTVTVQFSKAPTTSIQELEPIVRQEVRDAFQAEPTNLIIAFVFKNAT